MIIVSAILVVLSAQTALAEQKESKAFVTVNGRYVTAAPNPAAPRFIQAAPAAGAGSNAAAPAAAQGLASTAGNGAAANDGPRGIVAGGRYNGSRAAAGRGVQRRGKAFGPGATRKAIGGGGGGGTNDHHTEEIPPNFTKPGALIRTTGSQLPKYEKAENPRVNTVEAGEIALDSNKAFNVGQGPSVGQADKPDKQPTPNPTPTDEIGAGTGGASANSGPGTGGAF